MEFFMTFGLPVLIALVLGAVLGLALSFISEKLKVEADPRIEIVHKMLPNINCGLCGYPGCQSFAEALVNDGVSVNLCRPSKKPAKDDINKILGEKAQPSESTVPQPEFINSCCDTDHCEIR